MLFEAQREVVIWRGLGTTRPNIAALLVILQNAERCKRIVIENGVAV
jgi:hypothetical protein